MPAVPEPTHPLDAAADAVRDAAAKTSHAVKERTAKAGDSLSNAVDTVTDATEVALRAARDNVAGGVHRAGKTADQLASMAVGTVKKHPVRSILIVAGVLAAAGFLAGLITSRRT